MRESMSEDYLKEQLALANEVQSLGNAIWLAPGAEHALAYIRYDLYWPSWYATESIDPEKENEEFKYEFPKKCIFRGQGNIDWSLAPGLLRLDKEEKEFEEKASLIFSKVVEDLFTNIDAAAKDLWPPLNLKSGYATAQHYGMKTTLLDWTINPGVAIDMATNTVKASENQMGVVYWLTIEDAEDLDLEILLPPPFVYRLYLQRGFFTNIKDNDALDKLSNKVKKIVFPISTHLKCDGIDTTSDERKIIELMPVNKWFENLTYWSKIKAYNYVPTEGDGMKLHMQFTGTYRPFRFQYPFEMHAMFDGGDIHVQVLKFIYWLAAINVKGKDYCIFDPRTIRILKKHNKEYFDWAEKILQIDFSKPFKCQ